MITHRHSPIRTSLTRISTNLIDKAPVDKVGLTHKETGPRSSPFFEQKHVREILNITLALKTFSRGLNGTIRKDLQVPIFANRSISPELNSHKYEDRQTK